MAAQTETHRKATARKAAATRRRNASKRSATAAKSSAKRAQNSARSTQSAAKATRTAASNAAESRLKAELHTLQVVQAQAARAPRRSSRRSASACR